jgi:PAS domain S-box-containing protein
MLTDGKPGTGEAQEGGWRLLAALALGIGLPVVAMVASQLLAPGWRGLSLPFHSTLETVGATLGLVLGATILLSRHTDHTSQRLWIACALVGMAVLDICHSCAPVGDQFVWFHSLAVLVGGVFFVLVWLPEREVSRAVSVTAACVVILVMLGLGAHSLLHGDHVPRMIVDGQFTDLAKALNVIGGGLTLLAAINFAVRCYARRDPEDWMFLVVCLLFGSAGMLFRASDAWELGWWVWHLLRFLAYIGVFWLVAFRSSESKIVRANAELEAIIDAIPGLVFYKDTENRYIRVNQFVATAHQIGKDELQGHSLYDIHPPKQAKAYHDDDLAVIRSGEPKLAIDEIWITKSGTRWLSTSKIPYRDASGEIIGVIGVGMDVTERREAEDELREKSELLQRKNWIRKGQGQVAEAMLGEMPVATLVNDVIACLAERVGAQVGALFLAENGMLRLAGRYAYRAHQGVPDTFPFGEGLVGQAAVGRKPILLSNVPDDYVLVGSALGQARPKSLLVMPILFEQDVVGVIELASLEPLTDLHQEFLDGTSEQIGIGVHRAQSRLRLNELLGETQRQSEELQTQQEELRVSNEELAEQAQRLTKSEERLQVQQEELRVTNEELGANNDLLVRQKEEVERARKATEERAAEVALASKYKSEFLANMSHELRTPLNSLLLLAQGLTRNKDGNLTPEQVESAKIIHGGGSELLTLINDILDLSKIEAGRMDLAMGTVRVDDVAEGVRTSFKHMAEERGIGFEVTVAEGTPGEFMSDYKRVAQILRNLVSNAIKFTEQGSVTVAIGSADPEVDLIRSGVSPEAALAIAVRDTGIGIAPEQQKIIFEAFQQVDGGTARRYGGTGLGLSISRELAKLLGGEIQLESKPGSGSVFTLYLPLQAQPAQAPEPATPTVPKPPVETSSAVTAPPPTAQIPDDRESVVAEDAAILVVEDDPTFAKVLRDTCRDKGFKCLVALTGETALELAGEYVPRGVILDLRLPGMDGLAVLAALKENTRTRHIPVHVVSAEDSVAESLNKGAVGHAVKPLDQDHLEAIFDRLQHVADNSPRRVLVVEDDPAIRREAVELIRSGDVRVDEASSGGEALAALRAERYDCVVLDLRLPDMDGNAVLAALESEGVALPPVVVHTARDLTRAEEETIRERAHTIVIKDVRSQERLLDEVSLFLHRVVDRMPEKKRQIILNLHDTDALLHDRKVLIVDDDMRTTFAVARLLAERGMQPLKAENGERALRLLAENPDVALVLMDIMMPVMDGYETMARIRSQDQFRDLPILALTAKAMPEDREKCLAAGASDYMPKPVDQTRLLSMMRVWLYR